MVTEKSLTISLKPDSQPVQYKLLDYAIARCTNCYALWDPYVYPDFLLPDFPVGGT